MRLCLGGVLLICLGCAVDGVETGVEDLALSLSVQDLVSGQPVTDLSASKGEWHYFRFDVPANATRLYVDLAYGTGDADLVLRRGELPDAEEYDFNLGINGNREWIDLAVAGDGEWFIGIYGYDDFTGVSLVAEHDTVLSPQHMFSGSTKYGLSSVAETWRDYKVYVSSGDELTVETRHGTGDVRVYVRRNGLPTESFYDARSYSGGTWKQLTVDTTTSGTYYVGLLGQGNGYLNVRLRAYSQ